jgi:hypothetical protein
MAIGLEQEGFKFNANLGLVSQAREIFNGAAKRMTGGDGDGFAETHEVGDDDAGVVFPTGAHGHGIKDSIHVGEAFKEH